MPITVEIKKQIRRLSRKNEYNKIKKLLEKQLQENTATAEEILLYTSQTKNSKGSHVISADTINGLGLVVSKLDSDQKKLATKFYKLAADRNSRPGNKNCAICLLYGRYGIKIQPKRALQFIKKAVRLTTNPAYKGQYEFLLCEALRANSNYIEANTALINYLEYALRKNVSGGKDKSIKLFKQVLHEFHNDFDELNKEDLDTNDYKSNLKELEPMLNCKISNKAFKAIKQEAYFIAGKCHEELGETSRAWRAYCKATNKKMPFYDEAITARATLLKNEVKRITNVEDESETIIEKITTEGISSSEKENPQTLTLPQGIPLPTNFHAYWGKETTWFDSVDAINMKSKFEKRESQIEELILVKKEESSLIKKLLKDIDNPEQLKQSKQTLKTELEKLQKLPSELKKEYKKYRPTRRQKLRRHKAERHFFNPSCSKKILEICNLTNKLIEHRFQTKDAKLEPIKLDGKSTRLSITAERLFQEAVISLSSKENPKLGIPTVKEKPWEINGYSGTNNFGPTESYLVDATEISVQHRTNPKLQRLGDSFLLDLGKYSKDIYPFLSKLTQNNREKESKLAELMLNYGKSQKTVVVEQLKGIYDDADIHDVTKFNRICFLILAKEQMQWHSTTMEEFQLGMSIALARCLIMIEAGYLSFKETFQNSVVFSVYTHQGIVNSPGKVAKSCKYIDDLYMVYLQKKYPQDHLKFFKKHIKDKPPRICVLTREQAHQDLKHVYGGDSDTDDEGYDTDLSI